MHIYLAELYINACLSSCPPDAQNKMKSKLKLTVNTGQFMFSGEIYYTDPLIQLTNRW